MKTLVAAALTVAAAFNVGPSWAVGTQNVSENYAVSIAGIEIGAARLTLSHEEGRYDARLNGDFRFLFWSGDADARSSGVSDGNGGFEPLAYRSRFKSPSRLFMTTISFADGRATDADWSTEPPLDPTRYGERVPITEGDLLGAMDPISAFLIPARTAAEACRRSLKIFSGVVRFDIDLQTSGADGDATTCAGGYRPVSGHRKESDEVDRLRNDGVAVSFFEIAPGVWAPDRIGFRTSFGTLALERQTN